MREAGQFDYVIAGGGSAGSAELDDALSAAFAHDGPLVTAGS